jgi:hypothetical protein
METTGLKRDKKRPIRSLSRQRLVILRLCAQRVHRNERLSNPFARRAHGSVIVT